MCVCRAIGEQILSSLINKATGYSGNIAIYILLSISLNVSIQNRVVILST